VVLFDPWCKDAGNPSCQVNADEIEKADLVLVSHDHFDHVASAASICEKTGAFLGGPVQTVRRLTEEGFESEKVVNFGSGYMVGGGVEFDWIKVVSTPAFHSSDTACALGTIVKAPDGTTVYHAGDTSLFGDMELWARVYPMDLAIVPIGGVFTMDAEQASEAVKLMQPKIAMPIHYKSFPIIAPSAQEFMDLCSQKAPGVKVISPAIGEVVDLA
jgi:L-ascorbate metabolism protein UlaG (beta-lactamase superfamily)